MPIRSSLSTLILSAYPFDQRGRKKLVRFFSRWLKTPMLWRGMYGIKYLLSPENYIDAQILRKGIYEKTQVDYFCQKVKQQGCETFIDVGANIGVYSLSVLYRTNVRHIIAFEPDPQNRNQLCTSIFLNGANNEIKVRPEALSDNSGEMTLYAQRDKMSLSTVQSSLEPLETDCLKISVPTLALDDLYSWTGKNIAIKMDIEGHEYAALKGMEKLIKNNFVFLQVEIFDENLEKVREILKAFNLKEWPQIDDKFHDYYFSNT